MKLIPFSALLAVLAHQVFVSSSASAATFEILFPMSQYDSEVFVSDDGSKVLATNTDQRETYLWQEGQGVMTLGNFETTATGISGDGRTVLTCSYPCTFWRQDASFDGRVIVGAQTPYPFPNAVVTFDGQVINLGKLNGDNASTASAVSADGGTIVGNSFGVRQVGLGYLIHGMEPFRWTAESGMVSLGSPPGALIARANDVSGDGTVIVGGAQFENGTEEAFRWTEASGMQLLGDLPGGRHVSEALAVSADGTVIAGAGRAESHLGGGFYDLLPEAFIWTEQGGMQELGELLKNGFNLDLQNSRLRSATGVSADGNIIVGVGIRPGGAFAWRVNLIPEPSVLQLAAVGMSLVFLRSRSITCRH